MIDTGFAFIDGREEESVRLADFQKAIALLRRYRAETPLGHQPHMIAHVVDEFLRAAETVSPTSESPK